MQKGTETETTLFSYKNIDTGHVVQSDTLISIRCRHGELCIQKKYDSKCDEGYGCADAQQSGPNSSSELYFCDSKEAENAKYALTILTDAGLSKDVQSAGASFSCEKSLTPIEKTICGSDELSSLDRALNAQFSEVRHSIDVDKVDALLNSQRLWMSKRSFCRGNDLLPCLKSAYKTRLRQLTESNYLKF